MKLRDYQLEISDAVFDYLFTKEGNPIAASPGGTGKSLTMNHIIKTLVTKWPGTKVMSLVHDAKVISQNCDSMVRYWPHAPVGIYSSGLKMRDTHQPIIYAGIQSVAKRAEEFGEVHIVIIDECDLVSPKEETLYQRFIFDLKQVNPSLRVIGFTATPYRLGTGCLTNLDLWDEICIDFTKQEKFNMFIQRKILAPLVTKKTAAEIDVTNIAMRGGEFDERELQAAADTESLNRSVVDECIHYGKDRKHWLVFSSGIEHGEKLAKLFQAKGVPAVMLTGKDSMTDRQAYEKLFRTGEIRCLINCGLYGRGWDFPELDLIAWVRATQSVALWVQGCVRGTRTAPDKDSCLVLDFAGNTRRLGPVNDPIVPRPRRKGDSAKGEAPVKECPECHSYLHTRTMVCPDCGYNFPPPQTVKRTADTAEILATPEQEIIEEFAVLGIRYKVGESKKGTKYLKVTYSVGTAIFHEFLFFEHESTFIRRRNRNWWTHRKGQLPAPESCGEALDRAESELLIPATIRVNVGKKYPEVLGCDFDENSKPLLTEDEIPF
jgi:DNA repair protein RadD